MDHSAANHYYAQNYVRRALDGKALTPPDHALANGTIEVLESLYQACEQGGAEGARRAWETLRHSYPELANRLTRPSPIYHASELDLLPPVEWLIEGMLPKRALCEIHGAPGAGKSLLALHLAAEIAQHHTVLYLAAEGTSGYRGRVQAWETRNCPADQLYFWFAPINLMDMSEVNQFVDFFRHWQPTLIVLDTLARCMVGGDENSAKDMGQAIRACDRIKSELDATILLVHHTGKDARSGERGSSALRGACDSMIELTKVDDHITVTSSKLKDGKPFETLYYLMEPHEDSVVLVDTDRITTQASEKMTDGMFQLLKALALNIFVETGASYTRLREHTGITGSTLDRYLSRLKQMAYIRQSKKGEPYFITDEGRERLYLP